MCFLSNTFFSEPLLNGVDSDIKMLVTSILEKMPKWTPGKKDGKPVNVLYTIPIIFKLTN